MNDHTIYNLSNCLVEYPEVLNTKQIAQILHIGRNSTFNLLHSGAIRTIRCGRLILVPKTAIIDFINGTKFEKGIENCVQTCYNSIGERRTKKEDVANDK